ADKLIDAINQAIKNQADLFVCPELCLCGYPPEDLLFRTDFNLRIQRQVERFLQLQNITIILPLPTYGENKIYNSALVIKNGVIVANYNKQALPNYGVFDDRRYFTEGNTSCVFECGGVNVGLVICEDMWISEPIKHSFTNGADFICVINASPFDAYKHKERIVVAQARLNENNLHKNVALLYVNCVGGQDELVYDGASFMLDSTGEVCYQAVAFAETLDYIVVSSSQSNLSFPRKRESSNQCVEKSIYKALVLGVRDYVNKNGFTGVVLGLSGGIDSALTLAIAVDALGTHRVMAVMMPSCYTSDISIADSRAMISKLNVEQYNEIEIGTLFEQFKLTLSGVFAGKKADLTEENIQARIRGTLLMAISNKLDYLVLTTGNKSEMATGYATLYGDMAGGFAVLKDVLKTMVYKLSRWRNAQSYIIPQRIITRAPSAELRDNQVDQDSLPEYDILDPIIGYLVEDNLSVAEIINMGIDASSVLKIAGLIKRNEYKRRQSAVGPKISKRSFTKDWRYPITNGYNY
ncbi:MAG: NAD+ synthase, partial [Burkholderiales bacterium]|nr:NAD+ synthase [Burkholderiales bacterium]